MMTFVVLMCDSMLSQTTWLRWSDDFCLFIFCSPYSRNFSSPATTQTTTGMSSYLTSMSPGMDLQHQQQQIMWSGNAQNDEFLSRNGKLPEFHRFQSSTGFVNQTKNTHYATAYTMPVSLLRHFSRSTRFTIFSFFANFRMTGTTCHRNRMDTRQSRSHHSPRRPHKRHAAVPLSTFLHHSRSQPVSSLKTL